MHALKIPEWIAERGMIRLDSLRLSTTAVIVVDMQVIFVAPGERYATPDSLDIVDNVNAITKAVRDGGGLVTFTRHTISDDPNYAMAPWVMETPLLNGLWSPFVAGTPGHGIDPRMDLQPADIVVDKHRYSALTHNSSVLKDHLDARGIDTVIITGVATNACCETTARDASQLGYKTFFITDATAAMSDEEHNAALTSLGAYFATLRSTREMLALIAAAA